MGAAAATGGAGEVVSMKYSSVTESLRPSTSSKSLSNPSCDGGRTGHNATLPSSSTTLYFSRECWRVVLKEAFYVPPSSTFSLSSSAEIFTSTPCTLADSVVSAL